MHVNTTAASTLPVACEAFHNRPASSAKTRAPPGDWRRNCWVERLCMESNSVTLVDLRSVSGFVKGCGGRGTGGGRNPHDTSLSEMSIPGSFVRPRSPVPENARAAKHQLGGSRVFFL